MGLIKQLKKLQKVKKLILERTAQCIDQLLIWDNKIMYKCNLVLCNEELEWIW